MESKKNLQFNDAFEILILCFSVSHGAIEHLISFLLFLLLPGKILYAGNDPVCDKKG